jgi:hypothetical protein
MNARQTEFAQCVPFSLFRQLANAYGQIADIRMQLVLDFERMGAIGECFELLKM